MPAQIGGALADIASVQTNLGAAGTASQLHAGEVTGDVERLQNEIGDVTMALQQMFEERASTLLAEIVRATRSLEAADWSGASREAAAAAEAQLTAEVNRTIDVARAGVDALSHTLREQVGAFHAEVTTDLAAVMSRITDAYGDLASGADAFARNLAEADRTITFG